MSFSVLLVFLLRGALSVTGQITDCANSSATFELKKVYINGTLLLDVKTDHDQTHVLVQRGSSDADFTPIMSVNADPNSVPNLTFWGNLGKDYENRTTVSRTATKPGDQPNIIFTVGPVEYADGAIYSVEVENAHSKHIKCIQAYVRGPPTTPELMLVRGDCSSTEGSCARFICLSNSTTKPKNSDVLLRYTFSINGSSLDSDSESRYMIKDNELMIGGLTKTDNDLRVTCEVQEEDGHPKKVSTTYTLSVLPSDLSSKLGTIGRQSSENSDGTFVAMKGTEGSNAGWIAGIVLLLVLLTASGIVHVVGYCKRNKRRQPSEEDGEARKKLKETELNETGSTSLLEVIDGGGGRPANG